MNGAKVLRLLARARLVLAPFADGLTGRRSSVLAALSAGAPLLSSSGHLAAPALANGVVECAATLAEFVDAAQRWWRDGDWPGAREERLSCYHRVLDPERLDARLLQTVLGEHAEAAISDAPAAWLLRCRREC